MSCMIKGVVDKLHSMTDKQLLDYSENSKLLEGAELISELTTRLRSKKAEIYHLHGRLDKIVERHTS